MGKASRKKGAVKTKPRRRSTGFVVIMGAVCLLFLGLIVLTKNGKTTSASAKGPGAQIGDHWHAAVGVNLCGTWQPNVPSYEPTPNTGVHSHGDGYIHLHPYSAAGAGRNANVGLFYRQAGDKVSAAEIKYGKRTYKNGDACDTVDNKPGEVRWSVNGQEKQGDPAAYVPNDRDVIAIAFIPKDGQIGTPPIATSGVNPSDQ
jgi:hypothetical protein